MTEWILKPNIILAKLSKDLETQLKPLTSTTTTVGGRLYNKKTADKIFDSNGIVINMFYEDNKQHNIPHIHINNKQGEQCVVSLDGNFIEGNVGGRAEKIISDFVVSNKETLQNMWQDAVQGKNIKPHKQNLF
ncbi:MAG: DUF4160 domain-containing protein [Elusimicrobia bacterium]|nr:DUF4160 domain-containing protein [Elusimicrobiota bacterium]